VLVRTFAQETNRLDVCARSVTCARPTARQRFRWLILSFIPSSLMLGVTTHMSTDVAAVPLLWILPLALYLGTFVIAFSTRELLQHRWLNRLLPVLIFACLGTILVRAVKWWLIPLHLLTFFVSAMVCHRELARRRPDAQHLTEFYIWMSFGGMLGGMFNGLVAPQLFSTILEYPLMLAVAALARPSPGFRGSRLEPIGLLVGLPTLVLFLCLALWRTGLAAASLDIRVLLFAFATLLTGIYMFVNRPAAFGAMSLMFVGVIAFGLSGAGTALFTARSFFGVHRVVEAPDHSYRLLQHGSTSHGRQELPADASCEPTGYYHRSNPIGQLFGAGAGHFEHVAVVGLGSGGLACYAEQGDEWTFFEIDPVVERIAREPQYFTHLQNSRGGVKVVIGDGRLSLERTNPGTYDLIILDAFSSDAIPIHLLTREAVDLYLSRLRSDGIVAVHISNRYLNLEPVLGALARQQGLFVLANFDNSIPDELKKRGRFASHWVLLARGPERLASLKGRPGWRSAMTNERVKPWTDDYSNILQVLSLH
jgi:hypothetical protein